MAFWKVDKDIARRVPKQGLESSILFSELRERAAALNKGEDWFYVKAEYLEKALNVTKEKRRKLSKLLEASGLIEISRHGKDNRQFYRLIQVSCKPSSAGVPAQLETQPTGELETQPTVLYINKETNNNKETEEASLINLWNKNCKLGHIESISSKAKKGVVEFFKASDEVSPTEAILLLIKEINKVEWLLAQSWSSFSWIFSLESWDAYRKDNTGDGRQYNFMKVMKGKFSDDKTKNTNKNLKTSQHRSSEVNQNLTRSILPS